MAKVQITLKRSVIGRPDDQIKTCQALGLTRTGRTVEKETNAAIDGMIKKIAHLVEVKEVK
ncbi:MULTISPECIES: 50S ribosomal protein L30 [Aerococcus]|uniref:Large ribosomal subunit protein uL30 n=1 Tax=Aerococcus sanguinicola TaxID=119206 RepID=A0A5N1GQA6_9LACT|nr:MULTISPECIES: 50S ribosomal protein L30 [Aerococcus]KAA9302398.1 50S ribosomal protein L30 [Aerococcus sanguinicola]KAB0646351.1 50S ribosomal protein L30 [Aerococcus sanguinicola]MDK6233674.1 50S ribosomal protein L30 [Aerococcus sp. UMB10185]MDK6369772.1 50S ribosomal protein L30 [Aerococcus sp. UMB9870]MDK6680412.1 50S ribosomal protein L30 [Aerococcus sp. UMB8608]